MFLMSLSWPASSRRSSPSVLLMVLLIVATAARSSGAETATSGAEEKTNLIGKWFSRKLRPGKDDSKDPTKTPDDAGDDKDGGAAEAAVKAPPPHPDFPTTSIRKKHNDWTEKLGALQQHLSRVHYAESRVAPGGVPFRNGARLLKRDIENLKDHSEDTIDKIINFGGDVLKKHILNSFVEMRKTLDKPGDHEEFKEASGRRAGEADFIPGPGSGGGEGTGSSAAKGSRPWWLTSGLHAGLPILLAFILSFSFVPS